MRTPNRNRPDHRSTAFSLIILGLAAVLLLCTAPVSAENVAHYTVPANGSVVYANISFDNLSSYNLVAPGFFGDETALMGVTNLRLVNESGAAITPKVTNNGVYTFAKGNYTLQYTAPVRDGPLHFSYPAAFNVTVMLTNPQTTGHMILGKPSNGGVITYTDNATIVTFTGVNQATVPFYAEGRDLIIYIFAGVWLLVLAVVFGWYRALKNRQLDPNKYE